MFTKTNTIIAATLFALSTGAVAEDMTVNSEGQRVMHVSLADLNLESAEGQRVLETRIRSAVRKVCGYSRNNRSLREMSDYRTCSKTANQTALASLETRGKNNRIQIAVRSPGANTSASK